MSENQKTEPSNNNAEKPAATASTPAPQPSEVETVIFEDKGGLAIRGLSSKLRVSKENRGWDRG